MSERTNDAALAEAGRRLPEVAREAIRAALEEREAQPPIEPVGLLEQPAPVFVTLRINGALRGCIGSLTALCSNVVEETMDRARAAAFEDPRFPRLTAAEIDRTDIEISILAPLEPIASHDDLDPAKYGIEVRDRGGRRAVLLPEIDGIDTVEEQIRVTRQKAGIPPGSELEIRRFSVVKVIE